MYICQLTCNCGLHCYVFDRFAALHTVCMLTSSIIVFSLGACRPESTLTLDISSISGHLILDINWNLSLSELGPPSVLMAISNPFWLRTVNVSEKLVVGQ